MKKEFSLFLILALLISMAGLADEVVEAADESSLEVIEATNVLETGFEETDSVEVDPTVEEIELILGEEEDTVVAEEEAVDLSVISEFDDAEASVLAPPAEEVLENDRNEYMVDAPSGSYSVDLSSEGYVTNVNPFYKKGYWGECTWYCWGRAYEKCNQIRLSWSNNDTFGNAKDWYNNAQSWARNHNVDYSVGTEPKENSIAVYTGGYYGHVVFIEKIADGYAYYSDCNGAAGAHTYGEGKTLLSELPYSGYIYLRGSIASGQCGENVYWDYYEDGALEIHGSGAMWDFGRSNNRPSYSTYIERASKITIESGITTIGDSAFAMSTVSSIEIPNGVTTIGEYAFEKSSLQSVYIPASVDLIENTAFYGCKNLSSIDIAADNPEYLSKDNIIFMKEIDMVILCAPAKTGSYTFPDGIHYIGAYAFNFTSLTSIVLPSGVKGIGDYAFWNYRGLNSINLPSSIVTIGTNAFSYNAESGTSSHNLSIRVDVGSYAHQYSNDNLQGIATISLVKSVSAPGSNGTITINVGDSLQLDPVGPNGTCPVIKKWKSSKSKCASISNTGILKALKEGKAKITITPQKGKKATLTVVVVDPYKPSSVTLNRTGKVTLYVGETLQLNATLSPATARSSLTWSSKKKKVASVSSSGLVKALKKGTTVITVKTANKKTAKITVVVANKPGSPTKIKLSKKGTIKLKVGQSVKLKATLTPSDSQTVFTVYSTDKSVVDGTNPKPLASSFTTTQTAYKVGTATITIRTSNGLSASVTIKVVK